MLLLRAGDPETRMEVKRWKLTSSGVTLPASARSCLAASTAAAVPLTAALLCRPDLRVCRGRP